MAGQTGGNNRSPQMAVVVQRLDDIAGRLEKLTASLETGYVRKDVYAADRQADAIQLQGLEEDVHYTNKRLDKAEDSAATNRRLVVASFLFPLAIAIIVLLLRSAIT